jgi:hypothetical protein
VRSEIPNKAIKTASKQYCGLKFQSGQLLKSIKNTFSQRETRIIQTEEQGGRSLECKMFD